MFFLLTIPPWKLSIGISIDVQLMLHLSSKNCIEVLVDFMVLWCVVSLLAIICSFRVARLVRYSLTVELALWISESVRATISYHLFRLYW